MKNWLIAVTITAAFALTAWTAVQNKVSTDTKGKKPAMTCIVSGEAINDIAKAPRYTYKGKTYYFCCKDCLNKFKASPATYLNRKPAKANPQAQQANKSCCGSDLGGGCHSGEKGEQVAGKSCCSEKKAAQSSGKPTAGEKKPVNTEQSAEGAKLFCPVSEEEITPDEAIAFEYNGKRYYVCCSKCKSKFLADPETYAKKAEQLSPLQGKPIEKESR